MKPVFQEYSKYSGKMKPDRHLVRIAEHYGTDCFTMCQKLSDEIGDRVGTVDYVIWRAANLKLI